jgi:lipopolysaccharide/colanic/teichoic acid biosynthesis glycosyltransferase
MKTGNHDKHLFEYTRVLKRIFDIVFAIAVLVIVFPLILLIAIAIKSESRGPVFFRHTRVGRNGIEFKMWKFRTMVDGSHLNGPQLTQDGDRRITGLGKILRRMSLDELPQLFNVLQGNMSVVGPRPEIPEIVRSYTAQQKRAISVKPGITGLSQVNGRDDLPIDRKLNYEVEYVENLSLQLDLAILIKTIPAIISGRGTRY